MTPAALRSIGRPLRLALAGLLLLGTLTACGAPQRQEPARDQSPVTPSVADPQQAWQDAVAATLATPGYWVRFTVRDAAAPLHLEGEYQYSPLWGAGLLQVSEEVHLPAEAADDPPDQADAEDAPGEPKRQSWDAYVLPDHVVVYDRQARRWVVPRDEERGEFIMRRWLPDIGVWADRITGLRQSYPDPTEPALLRGEVMLTGRLQGHAELAVIVRIFPEGRLRSLETRGPDGAVLAHWRFEEPRGSLVFNPPEAVQNLLNPLPPEELEDAVLRVAREEVARSRAPAGAVVHVSGLPLLGEVQFPYWEVYAAGLGYHDRFLIDTDSLEVTWKESGDISVDLRPRPGQVPDADAVIRMFRRGERNDRLVFLQALTYLRLYMIHDPKIEEIDRIRREVDPEGRWLRVQRPSWGTTVVQVNGSTTAFAPAGRNWFMLHFHGNRAPYYREETGPLVHAWEVRSLGFDDRPSFVRWVREETPTGAVRVNGWFLNRQGWWELLPERAWINLPYRILEVDLKEQLGLSDPGGWIDVGFVQADAAHLRLCRRDIGPGECRNLLWEQGAFRLE